MILKILNLLDIEPESIFSGIDTKNEFINDLLQKLIDQSEEIKNLK